MRSNECGHLVSFYEVVRLKGKTMVELKRIGLECYLDGRCQEDKNYCAVRPLAGQFCSSCPTKIVVAKVEWEPGSPQPWRTVMLKQRGERRWMYPYLPEGTYLPYRHLQRLWPDGDPTQAESPIPFGCQRWDWGNRIKGKGMT